MVLSKEYSAYKTKASIVESMVEDDHAKNVKSFYESIGNSVFYYAALDQALKFIITAKSQPKKNKILVVATRVKFLKPGKADSEDYHAVCLVRDSNDDYFFFDPNGPVLSKQGPDYHMFRYGKHKNLSTSRLLALLEKKYNIDIEYEEKNEGIQLFAPTSNSSNYIDEGGYCMFYIYLFIQYLVEQEKVGLVDIAVLIRLVIHFKYSSKNSGVFPPKKSLPFRTVEIINKIVF